jgi:hypothetical protein
LSLPGRTFKSTKDVPRAIKLLREIEPELDEDGLLTGAAPGTARYRRGQLAVPGG